jgi:hypothetical protein
MSLELVLGLIEVEFLVLVLVFGWIIILVLISNWKENPINLDT